MYPHQFADQLRSWLASADHPGISQVRTCAQVGRWEQPVGVVIDLADGWRFLLQIVGTSPDGGDTARDPDDMPPPRFDGDWQGRFDYQQARAAFETEVAAWTGPRSKKPQAGVTSLLAVAVEAVKRADHPKVATVEIPDGKLVLKIVFTDGSAVHGLPAGYLTPGTPDLAHKAHDIPKEWS
jgi:hypothetical protein